MPLLSILHADLAVYPGLYTRLAPEDQALSHVHLVVVPRALCAAYRKPSRSRAVFCVKAGSPGRRGSVPPLKHVIVLQQNLLHRINPGKGIPSENKTGSPPNVWGGPPKLDLESSW